MIKKVMKYSSKIIKKAIDELEQSEDDSKSSQLNDQERMENLPEREGKKIRKVSVFGTKKKSKGVKIQIQFFIGGKTILQRCQRRSGSEIIEDKQHPVLSQDIDLRKSQEEDLEQIDSVSEGSVKLMEEAYEYYRDCSKHRPGRKSIKEIPEKPPQKHHKKV